MGKVLTITVFMAVFGLLVAISYSSVYADGGESNGANQLGNLFIKTTNEVASSINSIGIGESIGNVFDSARDFIANKIG